MSKQRSQDSIENKKDSGKKFEWKAGDITIIRQPKEEEKEKKHGGH